MPLDSPLAMDGTSHAALHHQFKAGLRDRMLYSDLPKVSLTDFSAKRHASPTMGKPRISRSATEGTLSPSRTLGSGSWDELLSPKSADTSMSMSSSPARRSGRLRPVTVNHHMDCIRKFHSVEDTPYMRSTFRRAMLRKYHNVANAWRVLDPKGHGRVSFFELSRAAQQLGYICDAQALWQCLDLDHDGFVRLEDIDADMAALLKDFATVVQGKCGSADIAWRQVFTSGNQYGRCAFMPFKQAALGIGFQGDVEAVFKALNAESSASGICFEEFALLDKWFQELPLGRWNYRGLRPSSSKVFPSNTSAEAEC